jgi:isoleucyl-tRNA synthetase
MAPVLCFTAEEVWQTLHGRGPGDPIEESVHALEFPRPVELPSDEGIDDRFEHLLETREFVLKTLETARSEGRIGNSLEAHVVVETEGDRLRLLQRYAGFLEDLFIVSKVTLKPLADPGAVKREGGPVSVSVERAAGRKCERCWHITTDVGQDAEFGAVCARCARALRTILKSRGAAV